MAQGSIEGTALTDGLSLVPCNSNTRVSNSLSRPPQAHKIKQININSKKKSLKNVKKIKQFLFLFFLVGSCYIAQTALNDDPPASASEALGE